MLPPTQPPGSGAPYPGPPGAGPLDVDRVPAPGELQIKEQLSWKTWQLLVAVCAALLFGMLIDYLIQPAPAPASASSGSYALPPASGSTTSTTSSSGATGGSTTTTTDDSTTTTVASSGTTTTTGATTQTTAAAQVLLTSPQSHGDWTSPAFSITAASWDIGWAFQCPTAPASGSSFEVFVTPSGGTASGTPAVSETGLSGNSVTTQSTTGQQMLVVQAPANCEWIVKVTGS